jgi:Rrf2 family transcriptional regulator, cysteine metabolism repressor
LEGSSGNTPQGSNALEQTSQARRGEGVTKWEFASGPRVSYVGAVKLSVKSDYAARAVLGLAKRYQSGGSVRVEDLGSEQSIPPNYLVQILLELKAQQIVKSQRGKEGGYLLAKAPAEITLGDILRAVHGQVFDSPALNDSQCPPELRSAWEILRKNLESSADSINFQVLLESSADKEKMYYI